MGKVTGFMEIPRKDPGYRPRAERVKDFKDVALHLAEPDLVDQAARCMDCGIPFCHGGGCPVLNVIPEFNDHVYRGRWQEALAILTSTNPFPEFTGRICPAPCETSCVLGINEPPVSIREIELAVIEKGFEQGWMQAEPPRKRHAEKIAVVGSGPAGLAAAYKLNRAGYHVTVYENANYAGGILRYGIPDFKLEKWVVERRVGLMEAEGVVFETGVDVGRDMSRRYLEDRYDIILLSGGAREPRDLKVPGRDLDGIHYAMDFLVQQNMRNGGESVDHLLPITAEGKRVVVIGGGDTGSDCVGTSWRHGALALSQFEIMPEPPPERADSTPWPLWPLQRRDSSSHKEGGDRRWNVTTESFSGSDGRVTELSCAEVEWVSAEPGARVSPRKVEGSEFTIKADLVLLAMGFVGPGKNQLVSDLSLELDARGNIKRDKQHMTSHPNVFVSGDMTDGASLVVRAIQDGKVAAEDVIAHLQA